MRISVAISCIARRLQHARRPPRRAGTKPDAGATDWARVPQRALRLRGALQETPGTGCSHSCKGFEVIFVFFFFILIGDMGVSSVHPIIILNNKIYNVEFLALNGFVQICLIYHLCAAEYS